MSGVIMLGCVSTLTRDSRHFEETSKHAHSTEDGSVRGKRMRDLRVMVEAVEADEKEVGKVAFIPAEMGTRFGKEKWYI
jgi:uncharacterized protein involved in high-affinity Fe2+ transport